MEKNVFRKSLVIGIIILFLGASFVTNINGNFVINHTKSNVNFNGTLDQESTQDDNKMALISDGIMYAQSFVPSLKTLTKIELKLSIGNWPDDYLDVAIRSSLEGNDLVTISTGDIPSQKDWIEFDFNDIVVNPGNTYFIVCSSQTNPLTGGVYIWYHSASGTNYYPAGTAYHFGVNGYYYWEEANYDLCFKTYGTKAKIKYTPFLQFLNNFLQNHPNLFPILQKIIKRLELQ